MFDWEDLRHFTVFAQEKSLSAAARQLKVDHATVARRVAALEEALRLKLVERRRAMSPSVLRLQWRHRSSRRAWGNCADDIRTSTSS
jgi:DNA-binding transcriptional LysR family regulator